MGVIRGQEMNKGNYTTMLNILQSKDSSRWNPVKRMGAGNAGYKRQEV